MLKAIIVEDEPTAQEVLTDLLSIYVKDKIEVVGSCSTIENAVELLFKRTEIQLIFLDIQLGEGRSGFELFKYLSPEKHTVIFTTAFEKHAVQALKLNAIDYLVKPIHFPDLILAVNKAIETLKFKANSAYLETDEIGDNGKKKVGHDVKKTISFLKGWTVAAVDPKTYKAKAK